MPNTRRKPDPAIPTTPEDGPIAPQTDAQSGDDTERQYLVLRRLSERGNTYDENSVILLTAIEAQRLGDWVRPIDADIAAHETTAPDDAAQAS